MALYRTLTGMLRDDGMPKPDYRLIRLDLVLKLMPRRLGLPFEAPDWATSRWHHFKVRALMGPSKN